MRFNLISNLSNGVGLQRDFEILRNELMSLGHTVKGVQFNRPEGIEYADVNIFLETVVSTLFPLGKKNWVIPNPEWWFPHYTDLLPQIDLVLCKTKDALNLFRGLTHKVRFLGFCSRDMYRFGVEKEVRFLHVAGNSIVKNTEAILEAFKLLHFELVLVTRLSVLRHEAEKYDNIEVLKYISDEGLVYQMNRCLFHLCPSKYEGFGHYLHEGQSTGAVVITLDAPPLNEFHTPKQLLMPCLPDSKLRLAQLHTITPAAVVDAVDTALHLSEEERDRLSKDARIMYMLERQMFSENVDRLMEELCSSQSVATSA